MMVRKIKNILLGLLFTAPIAAQAAKATSNSAETLLSECVVKEISVGNSTLASVYCPKENGKISCQLLLQNPTQVSLVLMAFKERMYLNFTKTGSCEDPTAAIKSLTLTREGFSWAQQSGFFGNGGGDADSTSTSSAPTPPITTKTSPSN